MSLEIFTQENNPEIEKNAMISGRSAEFLWGFRLIQGTLKPKVELVYQGTGLSISNEVLHQILRRLGYDNPYSTLYSVSSPIINSSKPMEDYRYFPFGSVEFYKQFYFNLNECASNGSITEGEFDKVYAANTRRTTKMLTNLSKLEWGEDLNVPSGATEMIGTHISEFTKDRLIAPFVEKVRERLYN